MAIEKIYGDVPIVAPASFDGKKTQETQSRRWQHLEKAPMGLAAILAGAVETIGQSVNLIEDDDTVKDALRTVLGEGTSELYGRQKEGFQTTGEIVSAFAPILLIPKLLRTGNYVDKALSALPAAELTKKLFTVSGLNRFERIEQLAEDMKTFGKTGSTDITSNKAFQQAIRKKKLAAAGDTFKEILYVDAALFGLYNESEFFFPADNDPVTNLALYGFTNLLFTSGAYAFQGRAIQKAIANIDGLANDIEKNINKVGIHSKDALSVKGSRGLVMADNAVTYSHTNSLLSDINNTAEVMDNALRRQSVAAEQIKREAVKAGNDVYYGHDIDFAYSFNMGSPEMNTVLHTVTTEPTLAVGLTSLNKYSSVAVKAIPSQVKIRTTKLASEMEKIRLEVAKTQRQVDNSTLSIADLHKRDQLLIKYDELVAEKNKLDDMMPVVLETDGSVVPLAQRRASVIDEPRSSVSYVKTVDGIELAPKEAIKLKMGMGVTSSGGLVLQKQKVKLSDDYIADVNLSSVIPTTPAVKSASKKVVDEKAKIFQSQTFEQRMHLYKLQQTALDGFKGATAQASRGPIIVTERSTFAEIDFAIEAAKKFPDQQIVNYAPNAALNGQNLLDTLTFQSLSLKFQEYARHKIARNADANSLIKIPESSRYNDYDVAKMLNLPLPTGVGVTPIMQFFDAFVPNMGREVPEFTHLVKDMPELKAQLAVYSNNSKLFEAREIADDFPFAGAMLQHDKVYDRAPVIALYQDVAKNRVGPTEINELIDAEKVKRAVHLSKSAQYGATHVATYMKALEADPGLYSIAVQPHKLIEGTQAGFGILTQQHFASRNSDVISSMYQMIERANRQGLKHISDEIFKPHQQVFNRLASPENKGSQQALNIAINELRNGWDVLPTPVRIQDAVQDASTKELYALMLDPKSDRNAALWNQFFGTDFKQAAQTSGGQVRMPVRVSTEHGKVEGMQPVALDVMALEGLKSITGISHTYLRNLNFLRDAKGLSAIPKREWHVPYTDLSKEHIIYITKPTGQPIQIVYGKTEEEALRNANAITTEFAKQGIQVTKQTDSYMRRNFTTAGMDYEQMDNFAWSGKQTKGIGGKTGSRVINVSEDVLRDVIKQLQTNLMDMNRYIPSVVFESEINHAIKMRNALATQTDAVAAKETIYDQYIRTVTSNQALNDKSMLGQAFYGVENAIDAGLGKMWDSLHKQIPKSVSPSQSDFDKLNDTLGEGFNPFTNLNDMVEKTNKIKLPPTYKSINSKLMQFTTAMVLRIADLGMPLVNFASVASVTPAVLSGMQRGKHESVDEWKRRIRIVGSAVDDEFVIPNTSRLTMTAVHGLFDAETKAALKMANDKYGLIKQEVAEKLNFMTMPLESKKGRFTREAVDWLSKPTDWSETQSRALAFSMFYNVGRKTMQLEKEAAISFAHKYANDVVGDYSTTNKPQIFQGAGMPFGLFTTWTWNYLQRVYGDVEGARLNAAMVQAFTQQLMFGGESMPGYQPFIDTFTTSYDGKTNLIDTLENSYGPEATDLLVSGSIANLTGMSVQNRAAVTLPSLMQGGPISESIPSLRTMKTLAEGVSELGKSIKSQGFDWHSTQEIISNYGVNGAVKNAAKFSLGYEIDRAGNLVTEDVRTFAEAVPRIFELKSSQADKRMKELSRQRHQQEMYRAKYEKFSKQIKTAMRNNDLTEEQLSDILGEAFKSGMKPDHMARFIRSSAIQAQVSNSNRQLLSTFTKLNDGGKMMRLWRLNSNNDD